MRRSALLVPTTKESRSTAQTTSAELSLRSGLVDQLGSGLFSYAPTGKRVCDNISEIIKEEMRAIGAQEVDLPGLQYADLWRQSGRFEEFEGEMFTFENRNEQEMCLAPTHEEPMADLVRGSVRSKHNMPLTLYQVGTKFRDDHARNGLLRTKEFLMKDAYSFTQTEEELDEIYEAMREAYINIFERLGVDYAIVSADPGAMGGTGSEEFQAPAEVGSDEISRCPEDSCRFGTKSDDIQECPDCGTELVDRNAIELGHIFKLGTRYSDPLELTYDTEDGKEDVIMGSYGIGVSRCIPALIEQRNDESGIKWPAEVAPFEVGIIAMGEETVEMAEEIHDRVGADRALIFDNDVNMGEKFAESDLIGIPYKVILGNNYTENGELEVEHRDGTTEFYEPDEFFDTFA